jgi:glycosyltransferase involved in cell wall biosynthesis
MNSRESRHARPLSISMLGWAFNEEQSIGAYIDRAQRVLESISVDYELIVIDDGSTDRTWEIAHGYQASRPWLRLYRNDRNRGSGYNAKRAIGLAEKEYLFWQTVDWSYDIAILMNHLHLLATYDVLQGVRATRLFAAGSLNARSDNPVKTLISVTNYLLVRLLFGLPLNDYQNVAVYPRALIQPVLLESESAFTAPECLLKVWWNGAAIKEVPVPFVKRQLGDAKGTRPKAVLAAVVDVFRWWWRWIVRGQRPDGPRGRVVRWEPSDAVDDLTARPVVQSGGRTTS